MSRKHDAALVALVATTPVTRFFPGLAPDGTTLPYAAFWPANGTDESPRYTSPAFRQNPSWVIHCVGGTAEQAGWVFDQLKAKLFPGGLGVTPTVPGERPGRFWFRSPMPLQRDDDPNPSLFWYVAECGFYSDLT